MNLKPSQCAITSLTITDHNKKVIVDKETNFKEYFSALDIYENIFNPFMTADLTLIDGGSFVEKYNISGDEDFIIEFVGYGSDVRLKYKFKVIELLYNMPTPNLRSKNVGLRLASDECLVDSCTSISKSYEVGTKEIVRDIVTNFLSSKKKLSMEDTKDPPIIVLPYLSPFQSIDFIRQRIVSEKYKSSTFVFFENNKGFNLTTVEGLFERGMKSNPQKFLQNESVSENVKGGATSLSDTDSFHLFSNYTVKSSFNLNSSFKNGGLKSVISQYDLTTKSFQTKVFENSPSNKLFVDPSGGKNPQISSEIFKKYASNPNKPYFLPFLKYKETNNQTSNFVYDTVAERICYSNLFTMEKTYVDIPGNTRIEAGSVVYLDVPRYDAKEQQKGGNQMDSGYYLVTGCKHTITNGDTAKFDSHLELMRFGRGVLNK